MASRFSMAEFRIDERGHESDDFESLLDLATSLG